MIGRFFKDIKRYSKYIKYSTRSQLKAEIIDSYLSWIWLFLEPLCFMLIYTFISIIVFRSSLDYFAAFVFIGLTVWNFFSKTLRASVRLVNANRDTVTKVYLPKFILLITKMSVNAVKFLIAFSLVIISMILYHVPVTINVLYFIPICFVLALFTYGLSLYFMHFGVFVKDLSNLTNIGLQMLFYLSGIFFAIETRVPVPYNKILIEVNPISAIIVSTRDVLLYQKAPNLTLLGVWTVISLILAYFGTKTIYKHENTYVKVMK